MDRPFDRRFYGRDPRQVAPGLLGAELVNGAARGRIVETEAYLGHGDPAAHAFRGRTPRTEVLFGPAGHAYVYRTRQHLCLNVAVQALGMPGCVLIRAVTPVAGIEIMRQRRGDVPDARLTDGPAKLCQAFAIDMQQYGKDLCDAGGLTILDVRAVEVAMATGPRVGISVAKDWPLRYRTHPP